MVSAVVSIHPRQSLLFMILIIEYFLKEDREVVFPLFIFFYSSRYHTLEDDSLNLVLV